MSDRTPHPYDLREAKYLLDDINALLKRYNKLTCKSVVLHDPSEATALPAPTADEVLTAIKESKNVRKSK